MDTIEEEPSATMFKHEPLPDSNTYIRLLEIQSVDPNGQVVCLLNAWPVASTPDYYALSYTWGSSTPSHRIFINECVFEAGQNCVYALKQAYLSKASRYFWMDALCIDKSTTQEKTHQVGMMGQIYAKSKHVLACVGPHTDDSTSLFRAIDENRSLLDSVHKLTFEPRLGDVRYWDLRNLIEVGSRVGIQCSQALRRHQRVALATAFIAFMKRPYFSRVWILQELHLAQRISLCCGNERRSFGHLQAVFMLVDYWSDLNHKNLVIGILNHSLSPILWWRSWFRYRLRPYAVYHDDLNDIYHSCGCLILASGSRRTQPLPTVLDAMRSFQCKDVRDRLFGVLALVDWRGSEPMVPDYEKDNYQIAIEIFRLYLDARHRPLSDVLVERRRELREIFSVHNSGEAMRKAITIRYGSNILPNHILSACESIVTGYKRSTCPDFGRWIVHASSASTRSSGHARDEWFGVQLREAARMDSRNRSSHCQQQPHLYCDHSRRLINHERPLRNILDQDGLLFAYAPLDARPNDWLLVSRDVTVSDINPAMILVRELDQPQGDYQIIGQASRSHHNKEKMFPPFKWRSFWSCWDAEDLFLFDWLYTSRSAHPQTRTTMCDWLQIAICSSKTSSYFHGPTKSEQEKATLFDSLPRSKCV